ncbi:MAG: hypothetical protein WD512_07050, partial [Candidatus Paceibacterota bacterium]
LLIETENCRFVTLTGTPIINLASELAVLFNILRGPVPYPKDYAFANKEWERHQIAKDRGYFELFPVDRSIFNEYFVENKKPKNVDIFKYRIQGLVSYYSGAKGMVFPEMVDENGDPTNFPVIKKVVMSPLQTEWYEYRREKEREKKSKSISSSKSTSAPKSSGPNQKQAPEITKALITVDDAINADEDEISGNFRIYSRMAGNFGFPLEILEMIPIGSGARDREDIESILGILDRDADIYFGSTLKTYSAKMDEIINVMDGIRDGDPERDGGVFIYSNFREVEGFAIMARALIQHGYTQYKLGDENKPDFEFDGLKFAILGEKDESVQKIIDVYNSEDNLFLPGRNEDGSYYQDTETGMYLDEYESPIPYIGAGRIVKILLGTSVVSE